MALMTEKLRAIMALDPERTEIDFEGTDYSWAQLAATVRDIEAALEALNLPVDCRVGIMLRNRPGHIAAVIAVLSGDRCLVSLNPVLPDEKLFADVEGLNLPVIIADATDLARPGLAAALDRAGSAVIEIDPHLNGAKLVCETVKAAITLSPGVAIEMLTSGTTGTPKRVPLSRDAFDSSFRGFTKYERGRSFDDPPKLNSGCSMVVNPLTHIGGIYGCIGALAAGRKIALLERFTVEAWVNAVRRNRPAVAPAVPSAIRMLLEADIEKEALSSLRALISGTAPLPAELVDAFYEKYGIPICGNYGATEMAGAVAGWTIDDFRTHWREKRGAVGRVQSNIEARVVDADSGEVLPNGTEGLLELKGAQLDNGMKWLRTTDRAVLDDDRFLWIKGRADNAIIRGGFKIHPDDVIKAINEHPSVLESAVVGIADARLGEVPAAAIILKKGVVDLTTDAMKSFLREKLIAYQIPVLYRFVKDFPRTSSMKPSALELKSLFNNQEKIYETG
jgi:long-chain acyl-CoA synthetase